MKKDAWESVRQANAQKIEYAKAWGEYYRVTQPRILPDIVKVIFNDPATIVFWDDGSKTVVKCSEHDFFDPEYGLLMAMMKKLFNGSLADYRRIVKTWCQPEYDRRESDKQNPLSGFIRAYLGINI